MKHIISICICVLCSILSCSAKVERYKIEVVGVKKVTDAFRLLIKAGK